jgi:Flp pilus assembly protein TadG
MVTVELVAVLPVLLLITAALFSAVVLLGDRIRMQDAAGEAARLFARGDAAHARAAVTTLAAGAALDVSRSGSDVRVTVTRHEHLFARWLPAVRVTGTAISAVEPTIQGP